MSVPIKANLLFLSLTLQKISGSTVLRAKVEQMDGCLPPWAERAERIKPALNLKEMSMEGSEEVKRKVVYCGTQTHNLSIHE